MLEYMEDNITNIELRVMSDLLYAKKECRRGKEISELFRTSFVLLNPKHRVFLTPKRNNNIFALVAETLWVLAGRDDMEFLSFYLPRATDFSDDGATWRAAYSPRLRRWSGVTGKSLEGSSMLYVDQFQTVLQQLKADPHTRRAVMTIHDPAKDWVSTKDFPCNNWLHFMQVDGKLNLEVVSRSMDFLWGSNINFMEFTVIQEILAHCLKVPVGRFYYYVSSCHMYEEFRQRFVDIVYNAGDMNIYEYLSPVDFDVSRELTVIDKKIEMLMTLEKCMRADPESDLIGGMLDEHNSEWLSAWGRMLWAYCALKKNNYDLAFLILRDMPESDLQFAGFEYLRRQWLRTHKSDRRIMNGIKDVYTSTELIKFLKEF